MPYPEKLAHWMRRAGDGRCQVEFYNEDGALVQCGNPAQHSHHVIPEAEQLEEGLDPNHSYGMGACKFHHVGVGNAEDNTPFTGDFSFHPDVGKSYELYRAGDKEAFAKMGKKHREAAKEGKRFWGGDERTDGYYLDKAQDTQWKYQLEHPEDPKPEVKVHPRKKDPKHWSDIFFGKRSYEEDEE